MNSNGVFDAMDKALGGTLRRYDAAEVAAGREPAGVQMHEAVAALVASCFFKAMGPDDLESFLYRAENEINKARHAARFHAECEYAELEAGNADGIRPFTR